MKVKKKVSKWQRKKRRIRAIKEIFGVGGLYFSQVFGAHWSNKNIKVIQCSKTNNYREQYRSIESIIEALTLAKEGKCAVLYEDEKMDFPNLDELRAFLLIQKIAGI